MAAPTLGNYRTGFDTTNTTSTNVTLPTWTNGDTLYIAIVSDLASQTFTAPVPFFNAVPFSTLHSNVAVPTSSPTATFALFYRTNAQHADFSFNGTDYNVGVTVGTTERQAWISWAVAGDGGIDAQGTNASGSSATATIPAVTTDVNDCLIFGVIGTDSVSTPHGTATGYTKVDEISGSSAGSVSLYSTTLGTLGTQASANVSITSEQWLGISFAIKPVVTNRTGTAAITLDALTLSATGTVPRTGAASITLDPLTLAAAGTVPRTGSSAITLGALALAATGISTDRGSAAITLGTLTLTATGTVPRTGTAAITFGSLTVAGTGTVPRTGSAAITLSALTLSAIGAVPRTGAAAITLDSLTLAATGTGGGAMAGSANITLGTLTLAATGNVPIVGSANITLGALTLAGAGSVPRVGSAAIILDPLTLAAAGTAPVQVPAPTIVGVSSGSDAGNTTNTTVTLATFVDGQTLYIAIVSDALGQVFTAPSGWATLYSNIDISASSPAATFAIFYRANALHSDFSSFGTNYYAHVIVATSERQSWVSFSVDAGGTPNVLASNLSGSSANATIPAITPSVNNSLIVGAIGADGATTPHTPDFGSVYSLLDRISGSSAGSISAWSTSPGPIANHPGASGFTLSASDQWLGIAFAIPPAMTGHANITLGALTLTATGTTNLGGSAAITLGELTLVATGTVPRTGNAAITLGALTLAAGGTGLAAIGGTAAITLGALTLAATGGSTATPITGTAAITLGALTLSAHGIPVVDLPAPTVRGDPTTGADTTNTTATSITLPTFVDGDTIYIGIVSDATSQVFSAPIPYFSTVPFATLYGNTPIPTASPTATFALFYRANAKHSDFSSFGATYYVSVSVLTPERQSWIAWTVDRGGLPDEQGINLDGSSSSATIPAVVPHINNSLLFGLIATDGTSTPHLPGVGAMYTELGEISGSSAGSLSLWSISPGATIYAPGATAIMLTASEQWLGVSFSVPPTLTGQAAIALGALTLAAAGTSARNATANITLGALTLAATGKVAITGTADITLGALTLTSYPSRTGSAAITLGALTLAATGSVSTPMTGTAAITLGALTVTGVGIVRSGRIGNASITLGALTLFATGIAPVAPTIASSANASNNSLMGTLFLVDVETAAGVKLGGGPIATGIKWTYKQKLSQAGEWTLEVPLAEPRLRVATLQRRVKCWVRRSGRLTSLGGGIIKSRSYGLSGDNVPAMTLSGPDLLRELVGTTVKFEVNALNAAPRAPLILNNIMAAVPVWTITLPAGLPEITATFVHESVLNALTTTCEKIGAFFYVEPFVIGPRNDPYRPRSIIVLKEPVASNIIATNLVEGLFAERNQNICLLNDIEKTESAWEAINRLIVYGAGDGQARLTLATATLWPDGTSVLFPYGFTDPYGRAHNFVLDKVSNTITDILSATEFGQEEKPVSFKDIRPVTANTGDFIAAANTLVVAAVNMLVLSSYPSETYRLSVAALRAVVHPGMQIRVIAQKWRDGIRYLDIDERLIIQEVDYEIDASGEKVTGLTVATTWKPEKTGATILAEQVAKLTALEAHAQPGPDVNTLCYREDVDDQYGAEFPFWLNTGTLTVYSITLRYKLEKLRSTVKTIGGTASGSVAIPSHSHELGAHHHEIPNHQHNMAFEPGLGGATVQIFSGGGSPDFGSIIANGIPHTIYVNTNADSGEITSDGNSSIAVSGGGNGTFSVNIANALTAVYGVYEDPDAPYAVTDLDWTANGSVVTEAPEFDSGWYKVDITRYLTDVKTLRPNLYANTVAVAVKTLSHADKKVRVTAQIELRTTVQAIAVLT